MLKEYKKGFTLIEMLIVALIFSVLVGAIIGVFVSVVRVQRYTLASQAMLDQTSYNMEYMSRHLRMAKKNEDECDFIEEVCGLEEQNNYYYSSNYNYLCFANHNEECQKFEKGDDYFKSYNSTDYPLGLSLFSNDLTVNSFNVALKGEEGGDGLQARATFFLDIEGDAGGFTPRMKIQTTVSQRDLDN